MNALRKQFEREKGFDPYNNAVTRNDYIAWLEARLEQKINGRNIIVENYKKQLESKAAANEEKVREDVIKKAYIAGVEDCNEDQIRASHGKDNYELEELYANFKTANQSLFTEEDKVIRCPKCGSLNFYESFKKNRLFHKAEEDKGVDWDALESKWHDLTLKEEHLGIENYENVFEFLKNQPEFQKKGAEK